MAKTLEQAIAQLCRKLLSHVEKLNAPRAEIDKGLRSLDAGKGVAVNIEELILQKNSRLGGA
jgi:predicted transcriptional regulator